MSDPPSHATDGDPQVAEIEVRGVLVGLFQENCWIIGNRRTREAVCVDPGGQVDEIYDLAKDMGVQIKVIAASHAHLDHIMGVHELQTRTGAKFAMHPDDRTIAESLVESARRFGIEAEPPPAPDYDLADGGKLEVEGLSLDVLHTPGHTNGSVAFHANNVLFSGDTLFAGSIGRTDFPGGDYLLEMSSIIDRLFQLPDDTIVLPGHMMQTTIGQERAYNPFVAQELARREEHASGARTSRSGLILPD